MIRQELDGETQSRSLAGTPQSSRGPLRARGRPASDGRCTGPESSCREAMAIGIGGRVLTGGYGSVSLTNGRLDGFYPRYPASPPDNNSALSAGLRYLGLV